MGLRIRKSIKIAPGIRLNFGKKGISTSISKKGIGVTFGPTGTTTHIGVPGTGISYVKKIGTSKNEEGNNDNEIYSPNGVFSCLACFFIILLLIIAVVNYKFIVGILFVGFVISLMVVLYLALVSKKNIQGKSNICIQEGSEQSSCESKAYSHDEKIGGNIPQANVTSPINPIEPFSKYIYPNFGIFEGKSTPSDSIVNLINSSKFQKSEMTLPLILGKTISGENTIVDLMKIHSILIVGDSKSGKSCLLESMILSLLFKKHPNEIKFVMMDMNGNSLTKFSKISNSFMAAMPTQEEPVLINTKAAYDTLDSLCRLVDLRKNMLREATAHDITEYNNKFVNHMLKITDGHEFMASMIVVIDEFGKLMMTDSKKAEIHIVYLCKHGANVGVYVVASTNQMTKSVLSQNITGAFQGEIIFKCSSIEHNAVKFAKDSQQLKHKGEFIYIFGEKTSVLQSAIPTIEEIREVTDHIYIQPGPIDPMELPDILYEQNETTVDYPDPYLQKAAEIIVSSQIGSTSLIQRIFSIGYKRAGKLMDRLETLGIIGPAIGSRPRDVLIKTRKELEFIFSSYHESSVITEKVPSEYQLFQNEYAFRNAEDNVMNENDKYEGCRNAHHDSCQEKLEALIGLNSVKEEVTSLANFIKLNQKRIEYGLPTTKISLHSVFTGNPGTGKTTVARLLAGILKELGVLKKGQLVETDRSGLIAEYLGQISIKTNKIIDNALDGVLFIDEAYTLAQGGAQDYGREAIATLLKRMEDNRDRLVVILAGYEKEMKMFIDSNPGLKSRFNRHIYFQDYSSEDLMKIFELYLRKQQYELSSNANDFLQKYFSNVVSKKTADFGNARFARNLFEKTIEQQANRLANAPEYSKETLKIINKEDIMNVIGLMAIKQ